MINLAVEALEIKRQELIVQKDRFNEQMDAQISELSIAIKQLCKENNIPYGDKVVQFDDESRDYIKSSQEEL